MSRAAIQAVERRRRQLRARRRDEECVIELCFDQELVKGAIERIGQISHSLRELAALARELRGLLDD